uniref:Uncharacterized protein n=2 Tax=Proboscia inermis TaxID=420281 RepID=A0A7S0C3C9_9STRA
MESTVCAVLEYAVCTTDDKPRRRVLEAPARTPTSVPTPSNVPSKTPTKLIQSFSPLFEGETSASNSTNSTMLLARSGSNQRQAHPLSIHGWLLSTVLVALYMAEWV